MNRTHPRLSLNQATIKYATFEEALVTCRKHDISAIGLWREPIAEIGLTRAAALLRESGLRFSSLCRSGFLTVSGQSAFQTALDDNRRAIEECATLAEAGAEGSAAVLVLVAGGISAGDTLDDARKRFAEGLDILTPYARESAVTLAIEPLHPMYVSDRAVISTLGQAIDVAELAGDGVGVVVDTFHVWWDPDIKAQIARAGNMGKIATYQVCDWKTPLPADILLSRHLPGVGVIDFQEISAAVQGSGYRGDVEVEVFNQEVWDTDFDEVAAATVEAFSRFAGVNPLLKTA